MKGKHQIELSFFCLLRYNFYFSTNRIRDSIFFLVKLHVIDSEET